jgi:hypothetical protein
MVILCGGNIKECATWTTAFLKHREYDKKKAIVIVVDKHHYFVFVCVMLINWINRVTLYKKKKLCIIPLLFL